MTSREVIKKMNNTSQSVMTKNTKLEGFLQLNLGIYDSEFVYDQEACVEDNPNLKIFIPFVINKFAYRIIIVCKDYLFLTDNPPKNLDNRIDYDDVISVEMVSIIRIS